MVAGDVGERARVGRSLSRQIVGLCVMAPTLLIVVYCVIILGASLLGGHLPSLVRLTHTRMQWMMSFVGGLMLGVALFHLLPHAVERLGGNLDQAIWWLLVGLLGMFFLIRTFQFHQHGPIESEDAGGDAGDPAHGGHDHDHGHSHGHGHEHAHEHGHGHSHEHGEQHRMSWIGVAIGLGLHTAIDGVALAADVASHAEAVSGFALFGLGTFLAIVLHKPLDALSITTLMAAGGSSLRTRQAVNAGFALMCPLGAVLFYFGFRGHGEVVGCALAFAAGVFLCISLSDLLPELQFHRHDLWHLSFALLLGIALAWLIHFIEPHQHNGPNNQQRPAAHVAGPADTG